MSFVDSADLAGTGTGQGAAMVGFIAQTGATPRVALAKLRETVSPEDFGAVGDGIANDSSALQAAINAAGTRTLWLFGTYQVSAELFLRDDLILRGASSDAAIVSSDPTLSILVGNGVSNVRILNLRLSYNGAGSTGGTGCVKFNAALDCIVDDCVMTGLPWSGVYMVNSQRCEVRNCRFSDSLCTAPDTSAVAVHDGSVDCRVANCRDTSGCHVSFFVQDTSRGSLPVYRTRIERCVSRNARVNGVLVYNGSATPSNTYNEIIDCNVADVIGDVPNEHGDFNRGSPIYVVGYAAGGAKVCGNTVSNGCQETTIIENAPAGISISNMPAGCDPAIVYGNTVTDMVQGDGIAVTSCPAGCIIGPNSVRMPEANDGTGPGGVLLKGVALRIENSSNVSVTGGRYSNSGGGQGVLVLAMSGDQENISLSGMQAASAASAVVQVTGVDARIIRKVAISGMVARTLSANNAFQFQNVAGLVLSGSVGESGAAVALNCSVTSDTRITGNRFSSTGTYGVAFGGSCANSRYDISNRHAGLVTNGSTGFRVELEATSIPTAGDFKLGDRAVNVSGSLPPSVWINTAAGSPGTFTPA